MARERRRVFPSGECWCGCDEEVADRAYFKPGHDKRAESAVIMLEYGGVAQLLDAHGFGPGKRNAMREAEAYWSGKADGAGRS